MNYFIYYLESIFAGYSPMIRITVYVVFILLALYLTALLSFGVIAFKRKRQQKRKEEIQKKYEENLNEIFYTTENLDFETIVEKLDPNAKDIKHKWFKEIITDIIIDLKRADTKDNKLNIGNYNSVLVLFDLEEFWSKEISARATSRKATALRKLESLTNELSGSVVSSLLYHSDNALRKLARSEFIKFESDNAYRFMEEAGFDKDLNRFDAIRIHDSLKTIHDQQGYLPQLTQWIKNTSNDKYKCFVIREIGFFSQKESAPCLMDMLYESNSVDVRREIVNTLGVLRYEPALPLLVSEFSSSDVQTQNRIIIAIGNIGKKESISFLEKIYPYAYNGEIENNIIESIIKCGGDITDHYQPSIA